MPAPVKREYHFQFFYILAAMLVLFTVQDYLSTRAGNVQAMPYSQFQGHAARRQAG